MLAKHIAKILFIFFKVAICHFQRNSTLPEKSFSELVIGNFEKFEIVRASGTCKTGKSQTGKNEKGVHHITRMGSHFLLFQM